MSGRPSGSRRAPDAMDEARALEHRLLEAHRSGDLARLSRLYAEASAWADRAGDRNRAAFFLTHAWVFALDAGSSSAERLQAQLRDWGRC